MLKEIEEVDDKIDCEVRYMSMRSTIHYLSDILYFSSASGRYATKSDVIKHHIKYLRRNAHMVSGSEENIIEVAKKIDTRVDARVAMKFCVAIPNDIVKKNQWLEMVRKFFSEILDVPYENLFLVMHESHKLGKELGTQNIHIHIVANTITNQGKKIRLGKADLSKIHLEWDAFLQKNEYEIRKEKESIGKIGWQQMKDPYIKSQYKEYLKVKKEIEEVEMKISVQKDRDTKQYPTEFEEKEIVAIEDILKRKYYSNIIWENGIRKGQNAQEITAVIFDVDGTDNIERVQEILKKKGLKSYIITTKSHTPENHHFRVIIETKDAITEKKDLQFYKDACLFLTENLGIQADNTFDLARMYAPSPDDAQITHIQGETLDIMEYIKKAKLKQKITEQIILQEKMQKTVSKTITHSGSNWLYADIQGMMNIPIKEIIKHFEGIDREWKTRNETYIRTYEKEKIAIKEDQNIVFSFKEMQGYGVLKYLMKKTGEKNINNIARILEKRFGEFGSFLKINEKVFDEKFNEAMNQSTNVQEFVETLKEKFGVKSVFIDWKSSKIKIAGIEKKINLDYVLQTLKENNNFKTNKYNLKR